MTPKILIAFDFDNASRAAVEAAARFGAGRELVLVHALASRNPEVRKIAMESLGDEAAILRALGQTVRVRVEEGRTIATLRRVIRDEKPELVVVGVHDRWRTTISGAKVGRTLVRYFRIPVLAVPATARSRNHERRRPNFVVGVDFGVDSLSVVDEAAQLAQRVSGRLTLCHVHSLTSTHAEIDAIDALGRLETIAAALRARGLEVRPRVLYGDEAEQLIDEADENPGNVIVVGTRPRGRFARTVLGSVAERVLRTAPGAVLVASVPRKKPAEIAPEIRPTA